MCFRDIADAAFLGGSAVENIASRVQCRPYEVSMKDDGIVCDKFALQGKELSNEGSLLQCQQQERFSHMA